MKGHSKVARQTTITLPISIGDTIYEKCYRIVNCRYFGDRYSRKDGQPACDMHEYDCEPEEDGGLGCDAEYQYYVKPTKVDDTILCNFAEEIITGEKNRYASEKYLLTKEDADNWVASHSE